MVESLPPASFALVSKSDSDRTRPQFIPGACTWCRGEKENAFGLCPHCGRFPNLNDPEMRKLSDQALNEPR